LIAPSVEIIIFDRWAVLLDVLVYLFWGCSVRYGLDILCFIIKLGIFIRFSVVLGMYGSGFATFFVYFYQNKLDCLINEIK
jgi:hypothetical protein